MRANIPEIEAIRPRPIVFASIEDKRFHVIMEDNSSAVAFVRKLSEEGKIAINMYDHGRFEKVGDLPWKLETNDERVTASPGDIILYQGDKIAVYYDENTWNFTKLGKLRGGTPEDIAEWKETFGGRDDITAEFCVEWTE